MEAEKEKEVMENYEGSLSLLMALGHHTLIDVDDFDKVVKHSWCENKRGYAIGTVGPKQKALLHRYLLDAPAGRIVDHANRDTLDNRRKNIRFCTVAQNQMNSFRCQGASRHKGVMRCSDSDRWVAYIKIEGKQIILGRFRREEDAAAAYNMAALRNFRQFARLNLIFSNPLSAQEEDELCRSRLVAYGQRKYGNVWISSLAEDIGYNMSHLWRIACSGAAISSRFRRVVESLPNA